MAPPPDAGEAPPLEDSQQRESAPIPIPTYFWGSTPDEDEYYASHGVQGTGSFYTSPRGLTLFARSWLPLSSPPKAAICMVHGYGNDISWTFQSTPIFLARHGFACFALDLPGHGRSHGLRAFVPDVDAVLQDLVAYFDSATESLSGLPRFLYGESMGAAICLLIHLKCQDQHQPSPWAGAVLVAPMCKIADDIKPPWPIPQILTFASRFVPTLACVPTADLLEKSVKVPEKKVVANANPLRYSGRPRLGTVVELLRVTDLLHSRLKDVSVPFLVVHGSADAVTDPAVSRALHEAARSDDKTIKIYDGMWHSLLFGEPDENVEVVRKDILEWLEQRCQKGEGEAPVIT